MADRIGDILTNELLTGGLSDGDAAGLLTHGLVGTTESPASQDLAADFGPVAVAVQERCALLYAVETAFVHAQVAGEEGQEAHGGEFGGADGETAHRQREMDQIGMGVASQETDLWKTRASL